MCDFMCHVIHVLHVEYTVKRLHGPTVCANIVLSIAYAWFTGPLSVQIEAHASCCAASTQVTPMCKNVKSLKCSISVK